MYARVYEHRNGKGSTFTNRYNCTDLIYYKFFDHIESAIEREKQIKNGSVRGKKEK